MMLYGLETCNSCKQIRDILGRTKVDWKYIDIAANNAAWVCPKCGYVERRTDGLISNKADYVGDVPALHLATGHWFIGYGQIMNYLKSNGLIQEPQPQQPLP